jgi:A/G-specific adenine glycosylase
MPAAETGSRARKETGNMARALSRWFAANQRDLPWRREWAGRDSDDQVREQGAGPAADRPVPRRDPYATWISEIMLQQTQVATVMEYYRRWMARFPDVETLAAAEEKDVLEAWAGLGYYSRARNVLATARKVAADHGGRFPWRREELLGLKGVGEYTAGAIASLAYNLPEPILDGNLVRVFSRLYALDFLPDSKEGKRTYWDLARDWAAAHEPGRVNEGLMELGALVCTPRGPDCGRCPLNGSCKAFAEGIQERLPPARSRKDAVDVEGYAVAAFRGGSRDGQVLLYTPRKPERLAGLLTFPVFPVAGLPELKKAWKGALPGLGEAALRPRPVTVTHSITHHRYRLRIADARMEEDAPSRPLPEGYEWKSVAEVERLLVSSLPRKIWKALK